MKKTFLISALLSVCAAAAMAKGLSVQEVKKVPFFANNHIDVISVKPLAGMYEVVGLSTTANGDVSGSKFMINKEKTTVLVGNGITVLDAKTSLQVKNTFDAKPILKDEAFTVGTGPEEFVLFTDPECPYCTKIEHALKDMGDKVKVHVFFFPLSFHKNANTMIDYVLTKPKEERFAALLETADPSFAQKGYVNTKKSADLIKKHVGYGAVMGVQGTPSLFKMDGTSYDAQMFMSKFTKPVPKTHVDKEGLKFLQEQKSMIQLIEGSDKPKLFVFTNTDSKTAQSVLSKDNRSKLTDKYDVNVQLVPTQESTETFAEAVFIMAGKTQEAKMSRFDTMIAGGVLVQENKDELDKLVKDKDQDLQSTVMKIGSMPQIMGQMGVSGDTVFVNADGKIVQEKDL